MLSSTGALSVHLGAHPGGRRTACVEVELEAWERGDIDWWRFDREIDDRGERGGVCVEVIWRGPSTRRALAASEQVRLRCQRWVERLATESDARREQLAADYGRYKAAHARAGANAARRLLRDRCGADLDLADRVAELIAAGDRAGPAADAEGQLLADADALSFFSLNAVGFLAYYGAAHTRRKVAFTLSRMSEVARSRLPALRLPELVRRMEQEEPWSNP
jgi:hypothetical protein